MPQNAIHVNLDHPSQEQDKKMIKMFGSYPSELDDEMLPLCFGISSDQQKVYISPAHFLHLSHSS